MVKFFWLIMTLACAVAAFVELPYPQLEAVPQWGWLAAMCITLLGFVSSFFKPLPFLSIGGITWTYRDFCRHWLITGDTGSGKTTSGLNAINLQLIKSKTKFGGLFLDEKGVYQETLNSLCKRFGQSHRLKVIKVGDAEPKYTLNLIGDPNLQPEDLAKMLADTYDALNSGSDQSFFSTQAQLFIAHAISAVRLLGETPSIESIARFLTQPDEMKTIISRLDLLDNAQDLSETLRSRFVISKADNELSGVVSTIQNILSPYLIPEIAKVFSTSETSLDFGKELDEGNLIFLHIPTQFSHSKLFINTFLKLLFYKHAYARFDDPKTIADQTPLVLQIDEAQNFLTASKDGASDHLMSATLREAKVSMIFSVQSITSIRERIGKEKADVLLQNMRNRLAFRATNEDQAKETADLIGKTDQSELSFSSSARGSSRSRRTVEKHLIKPAKLRKLKAHEAIIIHADGQYRQRVLPRFNQEGKAF